jgi:hypothetical protein
MSLPLPLKNAPQDVLIAPDGDIYLGPDGLRFVFGIDAVVQAVRFRLQFFFSEWFLNQDIGIKYFEDLVGDASKVPFSDLQARAYAAFAAAILDVPGITEILQLAILPPTSTDRKMTVTWAARTAFGDTPPDTLEM